MIIIMVVVLFFFVWKRFESFLVVNSKKTNQTKTQFKIFFRPLVGDIFIYIFKLIMMTNIKKKKVKGRKKKRL